MAEKYEHHLKVRREIQARYWDNKKDDLNRKRREDRKELKTLRVENNALKNQVHAAQPIPPVILGKRKEPEPEPMEEHEPGNQETFPVPVESPQPPPPHQQNGKIVTTQEYCIQKIIEDKQWTQYNADGKRKGLPPHVQGVNMFFYLTGSHDMNKSLQNYDKIEKIIREGKMKSKPDDDYSLNSRRMIVSMIVYSSDKIPGIILSDDLKAKYTKLNELYTIMSKDLTESKKLLNSYAVMKLSVYLNKIMAEFGQDSKEYLIARMYVQITARDDFHLYIVDRLGKTTNKTRNFLVVPRTGSCTIVLNTYKTAFRYNTYKKEVDNELTTLIRNYIAKHNIQYDECLFREQL